MEGGGEPAAEKQGRHRKEDKRAASKGREPHHSSGWLLNLRFSTSHFFTSASDAPLGERERNDALRYISFL